MRRPALFACACCAAASIVFGPATTAVLADEFIENGMFEDGLADWSPVAAGCNTITVVDEEAVVTINESGSNCTPCTADWCAQLRQVKRWVGGLTGSTIYTLRFKAHSDQADREIGIEISTHTAGEVGGYGWVFKHALVLADGPTDYVFTFRTPDSLDEAADREDDIWISLYVPYVPGSAIFDDVSLSTTPGVELGDVPLTLAEFGPTDPQGAWFGGTVAPAPDPHDGSALRLETSGPDDKAFAHGYLPMKLDDPPGDTAPGWDMVIDLFVENPDNIGRMWVAAQAPETEFVNLLFRPFTGLLQGWNTVVLPREDFERFRYWYAHDADWNEMYELGLKLESNGNGAARAWVDSVRLVPQTPANAAASDRRRPPIIARVNVDLQDAEHPLVTFATDEPATVSMGCGTSPGGYGALTAGCISSVRDQKLHGCFLNAGEQGLAASATYHCRIVATDYDSETSRSGDFTFTMPPAGSWIPADPGAFYPLGVFSAPEPNDLHLAASAGFNAVHSYLSSGLCGSYEDWLGVAQPYLAAAQSRGVRALVGSFCSTTLLNAPQQAALQHVTDRVEPFLPGGDLAPYASTILGHYLFDEPELPPLPPDRAFQLAERIRDLDENPDHPVVIATCALGTMCDRDDEPTPQGADYPYLDALDLALLDHYPVPENPAGAVVTSLQYAAEAGKPFHFIFQAYQSEFDRRWPVGAHNEDTSTRFPSRDEMRAMAWLGVVYGARGLWTFSQSGVVGFRPLDAVNGDLTGGFPGAEGHWTELTDVVRELRRFEPLLASTDEPAVWLTGPGAPIEYTMKGYAGRNWLIVVNSAPIPVTATFTDDGFVGAVFAADGGDTPPWTCGDDGPELPIALPPFGVRVFEAVPDEPGEYTCPHGRRGVAMKTFRP